MAHKMVEGSDSSHHDSDVKKIVDAMLKQTEALSQLNRIVRSLNDDMVEMAHKVSDIQLKLAAVEDRFNARFGDPIMNCGKCGRKVTTVTGTCKYCGNTRP